MKATFDISDEVAAALAKFSEITELSPDRIAEQYLSVLIDIVKCPGEIAEHSLELWDYDDPEERARLEGRLRQMPGFHEYHLRT